MDYVGVLYDVRYAQRTSPNFSCQFRLDLETTFFNGLHNVLLNGSARPFAGALYIDDLCWENLNFSQRLLINLLTNGLLLSVTIYRGTPYLKMMCIRIKSTKISYLTSFKAIASAHLEKIISGCQNVHVLGRRLQSERYYDCLLYTSDAADE